MPNDHQSSPSERRLADDARAIYAAAVDAARPDRLLAALPDADALPPGVDGAPQVAVVGAGKGAMLLAAAVEARLADRGVHPARVRGVVAVPHGYPAAYPRGAARPRRVRVVEGGHPVPDAAGAAAAGDALALADSLGADDALVALVSGGASALWPAFAPGIALHDARAVFSALLRSGADIAALNTVRKHLSTVGGGRLAARAWPAATHALVLSDVVGDDLAVIGSGPTVADPTTFADAVAVLRTHGLWGACPAAVRAHLEGGVRGQADETAKPGDPRLERARTVLLGTNAAALRAAQGEAARRGYRARVVARDVSGEARDVGAAQAARLLEAAGGAESACLLWGGETTVTVRGGGRGGRNQELALAAAIALGQSAQNVLLLSAGTDGIDGPTDAAGAWVTPRTAALAHARGLDPAAHLRDNDAYTLLDAVGALLRPGPTHTNVMDLQVGLSGGSRP